MKILVKFPTRGRPEQFLKTLKGWVDQASDPHNISFLVSCDEDDLSMTTDITTEAGRILSARGALSSIILGSSKSKIEACNRDIEGEKNWDVVLLVSDDMWARREGWDNIIREKMTKHFPDTDGGLWFFDGSQRKINTLACLGRKYYDRFGYIYEPSYSSFFCDDEQTAVGLSLNKLLYVDQSIASHEHPCWGKGMKTDALYQRNNKYWNQDQANYERRKLLGFPK